MEFCRGMGLRGFGAVGLGDLGIGKLWSFSTFRVAASCISVSHAAARRQHSMCR